jgi:hypothetical protein
MHAVTAPRISTFNFRRNSPAGPSAGEHPVDKLVRTLFTPWRGEEVVENKSFKLRTQVSLSHSFLDRTVAAQRPERRR